MNRLPAAPLLDIHDLDLRSRVAQIRLLVLDVDGVLTDGRLLYGADGNESKSFHVRDGYGIKQVLNIGIDVAIISGRRSAAVERRAEELGIGHVILGREDKLEALHALTASLGIHKLDQVACIGDDVPDLLIMRAAGIGVAVADAHVDVLTHADWRCHLAGGQGAVREFCDLLVAVQTEARH